jgi:hypothetical protein
MPVMNFGETIFIAHKIAGTGENVAKLGEMSLELAIFLEAQYNLERLKELGDHEKAKHLTAFFGQPQIRAIADRAKVAGNRGYLEQLTDVYGNLTPMGREKALVASEIIAEINAEQENLAYEPSKWLKADELIINATIPTRALRMLQLISKAITQVEQDHAAKAMRRMVEEQQRAQAGKEAVNNSDLANETTESDRHKEPTVGNYIPKQAKTHDKPKVINLADLEINTQVPDQAFIPQVFETEQAVQAYVPTATFGQKARTDLRYLIRYGLIELKAYVAGGRGRPKHVVRCSTPGERMILDLTERHIL